MDVARRASKPESSLSHKGRVPSGHRLPRRGKMFHDGVIHPGRKEKLTVVLLGDSECFCSKHEPAEGVELFHISRMFAGNLKGSRVATSSCSGGPIESTRCAAGSPPSSQGRPRPLDPRLRTAEVNGNSDVSVRAGRAQTLVDAPVAVSALGPPSSVR